MKRNVLSKVIGAGVISLSLATLPLTLPAGAQTDGTTTGTTDTTFDNTPTQVSEGDRDFDWGWLGLLGLIGLAGLAKKPEETVRYRDPDEVRAGSSTRY
jgi:hypothetical protein